MGRDGTAGKASVWFRWLGVGGVELLADGVFLAVDPFFTRPPFSRLGFGRVSPNRRLVAEKMPHGHHILVTHAHFDHVMDVPAAVRNTGAAVYGSPNTCGLVAKLAGPEARTTRIAAGDRLFLGAPEPPGRGSPFEVEVLPAEHDPILGRPVLTGPLAAELRPPLRLRDYRMDDCLGFLITVGGYRLLLGGGVKLEAVPRADVLLCSPALQPAQFARLVEAARPRVIVPIHWDNFFRPLRLPLRPMLVPPPGPWPAFRRVDLERFRRTVAGLRPETKVFVPEPFYEYEVAEVVKSG